MAVRPASEGKFEFDVPVVVVGAGSCGLAASLAVHDAGVEVLILEHDENPTGSTSLSAGLIPAAGTRFQREKGIDDSAELLAADLAAKAKGQNDPVIVKAVAEASGATIDWLADQHGIELHLVEGFLLPGTFPPAHARTEKSDGCGTRAIAPLRRRTGGHRYRHGGFGRRHLCR